MHIILTGGSGFLGQALCAFLQQEGHTVHILSRSPRTANEYYWNPQQATSWTHRLEAADVLINLAGRSVNCRYTVRNKADIYHSRIDTTQMIGATIAACAHPPALWLNASSATIYCHSESRPMTEETGVIGNDFSMQVCTAWEEAFFKVPCPATRKVALRCSIVLGPEGGAFPTYRRLAGLGLAGPQGSGRQMMSWIHINDFCRAVNFLIREESLNGPVNITSPYPIRNHQFMKTLRQTLHCPVGIPAPAPILRIAARLIGTETELLLKSRYVLPKRLLDKDFTFTYPHLKDALNDLCS